ncbi:MAG: hypothetical protein M1838_004253 [Thelocarpon superellum]|nr:MAG: hypothetical protein M1838_004253 [Thelocarpon superellum]
MNIVSEDCTGIKETACLPPQNIYTPEEFYVLYNIYSINQFFNSWWTALNAANGLAADTITAIVNMISPPQKTNVELFEILTALASSLAFLDVPAGLALAGIAVGTATKFALEVAQTAAQQTPNILKALYPQGTLAPATYQIGTIGAEMASIVMQFQTSVSNTVNLIESNSTAFSIWAGTGAFTGPVPSLDAEKNQLYQTLNTFVITRAYDSNDVIATVAMDTDVQQLWANSSNSLSYDINCPYYDQYGVCNAWWHDNSTNRAYALDSLRHMSKNFNSDMETIFSNNWTTGALLFAGADQCKGTPNYQQSPGISDFSPTQGLTTACMSTLTMCTWQMGCNLAAFCEFSDCPTQDGFEMNGCGDGDSSIYSVNVPYGYIGDFLTNANPLSEVCNTGP